MTSETDQPAGGDAPRSRTERPEGAGRRRKKAARRNNRAPTLTTIYWRDIPAQVNAADGGEKAQAILHHRFQDAIDRSAAVAGLTNAHDYVNEWRRVAQPLDGHLETAATDEAARLEAEYPPSRLHALVKQGGLEQPSPDHTEEDQESLT